MLTNETNVFLQHPEETARRILHPGEIVECIGENTYTAVFEESDLGLQPELEFLIYHELRQEFMKQGARIVEIIVDEEAEDPTHPLVAFQTTTDPASAESRETYRVSTVISKLTAIVDDHECQLLDVSITGFAVASNEDHKIGSVVSATLTEQGKKYTGTACVQSSRQLPDGSTRYGLLCSASRKGDVELRKGLHRMSMSLQREQLRRLAGAA